MQQIVYPVRLELRIDWSEIDYFGHVNNVSFFKYIQASRVNYWQQVGIYQWHKDTNTGPILASSKCDFRHPLYFPGNIVIEARVDDIRNSSFTMHHRILNEQAQVCAEAQDIMVMYDFNKDAKVHFPDQFRDRIEALEGRSFNNQ